MWDVGCGMWDVSGSDALSFMFVILSGAESASEVEGSSAVFGGKRSMVEAASFGDKDDWLPPAGSSFG